MNRNEVFSVFISLGWKKVRDKETRETYFEIDLGEKIVTMHPGYRGPVTAKRLLTLQSVDLKIFNNYVREVGSQHDRAPLYVENTFLRHMIFTEAVIKKVSDDIIAWAGSLDLDAAIETLRNLPTNCLGAMPLRHLAALAYHGDVDRLRGYAEAFIRGDRLGFVPYITFEMVEKALHAAESVSKR